MMMNIAMSDYHVRQRPVRERERKRERERERERER
jgi:hypothetical protein